MLGQIFLAVIVITSVLGMSCILWSLCTRPFAGTVQPVDPRYTDCTKPQQTSSGHENSKKFSQRPQTVLLHYMLVKLIIAFLKLENNIILPQSFIAQAEEFLKDDDIISDPDLEIDEDLLD